VKHEKRRRPVPVQLRLGGHPAVVHRVPPDGGQEVGAEGVSGGGEGEGGDEEVALKRWGGEENR
jgi:hypothetical protein